ncbi:hypothetical protein, partial [Metapseudomonas resinovorans]|uniref:hypothetical protein n=1 Tax=Metapseudomonas resinovorans TaxID=53412 RepID=UPI001F404E2F
NRAGYVVHLLPWSAPENKGKGVNLIQDGTHSRKRPSRNARPFLCLWNAILPLESSAARVLLPQSECT